ncbi:MAG: PHP domain-containing protein [Bacillota bacterium]
MHVHTTFSSDSILKPRTLIPIAAAWGLDGVAVTDHNTMDGVWRLLALNPPLRVIPGEEITTRQGEIIGLFLREAIPAGLEVAETIGRIHAQGGVVTAPHLGDRLRHHVLQRSCWPEVLPLVDLIEGFNGRTVFKADDRLAQQVAAEYEKPLISGSDCHTPWELGRCGLEMRDFNDGRDFVEAVKESRFFGKYAPVWVHVITKIKKYTLVF